MGNSFGPPAPRAGTLRCGQLLSRATAILPALFLASTMLVATTEDADAKRAKGWHGARHVKTTVRTSRSGRMSSRKKFRPAMRLGGPRGVGAMRKHARRSKQVHLASLAPETDTSVKSLPSLSGADRIAWRASPSCLADELKPILAHIAANFGTVRVNSTCRSHAHNRRVGGARHSYHLKGQAADFTLRGNIRGALAYLRSSSAGGIKHYGGGVFHIDTGPRRTW